MTRDEDKEPPLKSVMELLGSMTSRMGTYERRLEGMTTEPPTAQAVFTAPLNRLPAESWMKEVS